MSLNPQLVPVALPANTNKGPVYFPLAYEGELILASRDQSNFTINGPRQYKFSGGGTVYLTNFRMVFVPNKATPNISAVELPLLFTSDENVCQPIFGANYLSGKCTPVDAPPNSSERIDWRLKFTNGGMGTMVPLFYSTLEFLRLSSRHIQENPTEEPLVMLETPSFVHAALVDPSDPTRVYLTQPQMDPSFHNHHNKTEKYPVV